MTVTRLLVANRGEIARRIVRSALAMGIETVAVMALDDESPSLAAEADRVVRLPGRSAAETYLDPEILVEAARRSGADAVHPGYGFLSERASFAQAVVDAGLTWVGPSPSVIEAMGNKLAAKATMAAAGVPVLPSVEITPGADLGDAVAGALDQLSFPVLVKAAAGGGGKGMRVVARPEDLADAVAAARREAAGAFGDPSVFLERYVVDARHVEVQVLADDHGHLVVFTERDCSVQRRHQKVVEESPSPAVGTALRAELMAAATAAARAVDYRSAGTVELVLEPSGAFWFLEMNTRLQVEHPVSEAIHRVDLVREQLLVAQGLPLSVTEAQLVPTGHAVEARLYAEDPGAGFLPATGTVLEWSPAGEPEVRWDCGVATGTVVDTRYDPLLAKVVAHAPTRSEAVRRLATALARSRIRGVTTNRDFLVATLRHPEFLAGSATTSFIERSGVALARQPTPGELQRAAAAAALAAQAERRARAEVLASLPSGWRLAPMPPQRVRYEVVGGAPEVPQASPASVPSSGEDGPGGEVSGGAVGDPGRGSPRHVEVTYRSQGNGTFLVDGEPVGFRVHGGGWVLLETAGWLHRLHVHRVGDRVWVQGPDGDVALRELPRFPDRGTEAPVPGALSAPMPGTVLEVAVAPGEGVGRGQLLVVVEAMKMEHRVTAPHPGTVAEVRVHPGVTVAAGDPLVVLAADPVPPEGA